MTWFRRNKLAKAETTIGAIVVKMGLAKPRDIEHVAELISGCALRNGKSGGGEEVCGQCPNAHRCPKDPDLRLGELLVETGVISADALEAALDLQAKFRNGQEASALLEIAEHRAEKQHARITGTMPALKVG